VGPRQSVGDVPRLGLPSRSRDVSARMPDRLDCLTARPAAIATRDGIVSVICQAYAERMYLGDNWVWYCFQLDRREESGIGRLCHVRCTRVHQASTAVVLK
jgi:hypothetical protein